MVRASECRNDAPGRKWLWDGRQFREGRIMRRLGDELWELWMSWESFPGSLDTCQYPGADQILDTTKT